MGGYESGGGGKSRGENCLGVEAMFKKYKLKRKETDEILTRNINNKSLLLNFLHSKSIRRMFLHGSNLRS